MAVTKPLIVFIAFLLNNAWNEGIERKCPFEKSKTKDNECKCKILNETLYAV